MSNIPQLLYRLLSYFFINCYSGATMDHLSHSKTFIDPTVSRDQGKNKLSAAIEMGFQQQWQYSFSWLLDFLMYSITPSPMVCPRYIFFKQKRHECDYTSILHQNIRAINKGITVWLEEEYKRASQGSDHGGYGTKQDGGWKSRLSVREL